MGREHNEAPLEQNEKNLECDGVHYKVVLENPSRQNTNVSSLFCLTFD